MSEEEPVGDYWEDSYDPQIPEPDPYLYTIMFAEDSFLAEMLAARDEARRRKWLKKTAARSAAARAAARERPAS